MKIGFPRAGSGWKSDFRRRRRPRAYWRWYYYVLLPMYESSIAGALRQLASGSSAFRRMAMRCNGMPIGREAPHDHRLHGPCAFMPTTTCTALAGPRPTRATVLHAVVRAILHAAANSSAKFNPGTQRAGCLNFRPVSACSGLFRPVSLFAMPGMP